MVPALGALFLMGGVGTLIALAGSSPAPKKQASPSLPPAPPKTRSYAIGGGLPPPVLQQVMNALRDGTPAELGDIARDIETSFPMAAAALRQRAAEFGPAPQPSDLPLPAPPVPTAVPPTPEAAPAPAPGATAALPAIDPGMTPEWQTAIWGALATEYDPDALRGLASHLKDLYPNAAALLLAKAAKLSPPGTAVSPAPPTVAPPVVSPTVAATWNAPPPVHAAPPAPRPVPSPTAGPPGAPSPTEMAARNAGRPQGYPYITLRGEATYPAQIAREATGNEMNYSQLSAINPQFVRDGAHWMNIQRGDEINIPAAWRSALASRYHVSDAAPPGGTFDAGGGGSNYRSGETFADPGAHAVSTAPPATSRPAPGGEPPAPAPVSLAPSTPAPVMTPPSLSVVPPVTAPTPIQNLPNAQPPHASGDGFPVGYHTSSAESEGPAAGGSYTVKSGDFPIKIAKKLVGDGSRWHELVAANPRKKTKADGNFATLVPGEVIQLPASWSAAPPAADANIAMLGGAHAQHA